jgi:hypothetical protein
VIWRVYDSMSIRKRKRVGVKMGGLPNWEYSRVCQLSVRKDWTEKVSSPSEELRLWMS